VGPFHYYRRTRPSSMSSPRWPSTWCGCARGDWACPQPTRAARTSPLCGGTLPSAVLTRYLCMPGHGDRLGALKPPLFHTRQCRVSAAPPWRSQPFSAGAYRKRRPALRACSTVWASGGAYASSQLVRRQLLGGQRPLGRQDHGPLLVNLQTHPAHTLSPNA
jgi:hypothetical protein